MTMLKGGILKISLGEKREQMWLTGKYSNVLMKHLHRPVNVVPVKIPPCI